MKLYLSSYLIGSEPNALSDLIGGNKRAAIIMNASDVYGDAKRPEYFRKYALALNELGLYCDEIDLRQYFHRPDAIADILSQYGLLWVTGGNTFTLRRAFHASGLDACIRKLLSNDDLVYGGFSAGTCILCPSLRGIDLADEPNAIPKGYSPEVIRDGLGRFLHCPALSIRPSGKSCNGIGDRLLSCT